MAGNSPLSTSAALRARSCRKTPAYAAALSHATLLLAPEAVRGWHAANLVLTALWSRLLSLRICFVRRRSPDPVLRPTVGLQLTRRRSGTGSPSAVEDGRVRGPLPEPAFEVPGSSRAAAADCSLQAPAAGRRDGTIRSPASYLTRARERPSSEVWRQPAGARKIRGRSLLSGLGPAPPGSNMPPHSGLVCKGPERIFTGAAAMKPWETSCATNEPRNAYYSFRLPSDGFRLDG